MLGLDSEWIRFIDIRVRVLGSPVTTDDIKSVAEHRGVPFATAGMRVLVGQSSGRIVGGNSSMNFDVLFDDGPYKGERLNCHPRWEMAYFDDDGNVLADFREPLAVMETCQ
jgi:hypothetical protein